MKTNKIKKTIKRTITYTEYEGGIKRLKADLPEVIKRWIAENYIRELFAKQNA